MDRVFGEMEDDRTIYCGPHYVRTTITRTPSVVRKWVRNIRYHHRRRFHRVRIVVGLGVQWFPGRQHKGAATIQLCVENSCLIFQIKRSRYCPAVLRRFLVDPDVILVGVWNSRYSEMLMNSRHRVEVGKLVDLRKVASDFWPGCSRRSSLGTLVEEVLGLSGMHKNRGVGESYWDNPYLCTDQVEYACHDAFLSFLIAEELIRVWNWVEPDSDYDSDQTRPSMLFDDSFVSRWRRI